MALAASDITLAVLSLPPGHGALLRGGIPAGAESGLLWVCLTSGSPRWTPAGFWQPPEALAYSVAWHTRARIPNKAGNPAVNCGRRAILPHFDHVCLLMWTCLYRIYFRACMCVFGCAPVSLYYMPYLVALRCIRCRLDPCAGKGPSSAERPN